MNPPPSLPVDALLGPPTDGGLLGPTWSVPVDGHTWLVRKLEGTGLLVAGAALQHATRGAHPRLRPPRHWWLDDGALWLATERPEGTPLADADLPPWTFTEAMDALLPLCQALRDAHRRGVLHGGLAPQTLFVQESPIIALSAVELGPAALHRGRLSPFWAPERDGDAPLTPAADVYSLARLVLYLTLPADQAIADRPSFTTLPAFAIPALDAALARDPADRPQTIDELLSGLRISPAPTSTTASSETLRGRVRDIEPFDHPRRGPGLRFHLGPASFFVYRDQSPALFAELSLLWNGAELHLFSPRKINDSSGRTFWTAGSDTQVVVEPHWPVSVTNVLTARGCPQRVFVDARDPGTFSHHLPFGNLVHQFLEELVADGSLTHQEALDRCLPALRLDFLAAGVGDAELADLVGDSAEHFAWLRTITGRGWKGHHAEVTRFSTRYGLEGRTDLVVHDPTRGLQILELKTGRPWTGHHGQVQSYALLWEEWARRESAPLTGYLLYSKVGKQDHVPLQPGAPTELLRARNHLLFAHQKFVDPRSEYEPPTFMEHPRLCRQNECRFRRDRCSAQTDLLGLARDAPQTSATRPDLSPDLLATARAHHAHFASLVERERWADHVAMGVIFRPERLPDRIADGAAVADLTLDPEDTPDRVRLTGPGLHIFSPGDTLLLHRGHVESTQILRGVVVDSADGDRSCLRIRLFSGPLAPDHPGPGWNADRLPARIGYRTSHRALYRVLRHGHPGLLKALFSPEPTGPREARPQEASPHPTRAASALLNDTQTRAVTAALAGDPITLIQGPPGTGKTTVAAHLAMECAARGEKVLLSALTNTAVDTLILKLLDAAEARGDEPPRVLRLGSSIRSPHLATALRRRGIDPAEVFADDLGANATSQERLAAALLRADFVATTAHKAIRHPAMTFFAGEHGPSPFDVVLIDEASQLTEPLALSPLSFARRGVLIGDPNQLPPIVTSELALSDFLDVDDPSLQAIHVGGLDRSLFERLENTHTVHLLATQYRMHRDVMAFPSAAFYDDRLVAHESCADRKLPDLESSPLDPVLTPDHPVTFVDIDGDEDHRTNPREADALATTVAELLASDPHLTLGVISPFRAQVHLLRQSIPRDPRLQIDTVERFQGNEKDVILISTVKTDSPGDFLSDPRRLNVALTRARKKLILFGSRSCLEQDPRVRSWLEHPRTHALSWNDLP